MNSNPLRDKSKEFALRCISLCNGLAQQRREYVISNQLFKSGTSIGANIREGIYAQSKADFISKLNISLKEAAESQYWLELLHESGYIDTECFTSHNRDCEELIKLLTSIIKSAKQNS